MIASMSYLIAFYDTRVGKITRMQFAGEWPVSQMNLGVVHQLLVSQVPGPTYHVADLAHRRLVRHEQWAWTHQFLRPEDLAQ